MEYLDFELPLKELEDQLDKCNVIGDESKVDVRDTCKKLKLKIEKTKKSFFVSFISTFFSLIQSNFGPKAIINKNGIKKGIIN